MKFYLCQTAEGPRYARTQADAKALDPKFKLVEFDTDQASLVAKFNELLAQGAVAPIAAEMIEAAHEPVPPTPIIVAPTPSHDPNTGVPLRSMTLTEIDKIMVRTSVEEAIFSMDAKHLDKLPEVIAERRAELEKAAAAVQPVAPRARTRKPA